MMKVTISSLLSLFIASWILAENIQNQPAKREVGNLAIEEIPDIPQRIIDRMNQYQNTRSANLSDWHPLGDGILISTRFGDTVQLHHVSKPGAYRKQITFFREPVNSAEFSPRKEKKGFIFSMDKGGGEFDQLYWFDLDSGRYSMLTDGGRSVNRDFLWSNDGGKVVFDSTKRNGKDYDICLMDGLDPKTIRIVKQVVGSWSPLDWSADDSLILINEYISANEGYLYLLDAKSGKTIETNPTNRQKKISYGTAVFARDRKGIYYSSDEDSEFQRLTFYDLDTKKKEILTPASDWDVDSIAVSKDGIWLAYTMNEDGISKLYLAKTTDLSKPQMVDLPKSVISNLDFNSQNTHLGFSLSSAQAPSDVYSVELATNKVDRWTFSEVGGLNPQTFVYPELIHFPTFDEVSTKATEANAKKTAQKRMIPAFYYKPRKDSKNPFPVVILIHGGPESQTVPSFNSTIQYWVNELGVAVLSPNVRGSSGYGKSYLSMDNGKKREESVKDIGKLLDWIATRPELDSKRVAVYGGSYGGYMALASLFHYSDRLKCGVDNVGISNFVTFLQNTEKYRQDLRRAEYGDERDPGMRAFLNAISPATNADKITVPLFVVQGQNDPRVPKTEAEQIVKVVRGHGHKVWYLLGKDEGHGFQKKVNRDFFQNAVSLFFEEHLLK